MKTLYTAVSSAVLLGRGVLGVSCIPPVGVRHGSMTGANARCKDQHICPWRCGATVRSTGAPVAGDSYHGTCSLRRSVVVHHRRCPVHRDATTCLRRIETSCRRSNGSQLSQWPGPLNGAPEAAAEGHIPLPLANPRSSTRLTPSRGADTSWVGRKVVDIGHPPFPLPASNRLSQHHKVTDRASNGLLRV